MIRQDFSVLIERAERVVTAIEKWGGNDVLANRIDLVDEYLMKIRAKTDVIVQLDKIGNNLYRFKSLMTVDETALYLGIQRDDVHRLLRSQGIQAYRPFSSKMLILTEDLAKLYRQHSLSISGNSQKAYGQKAKGEKV